MFTDARVVSIHGVPRSGTSWLGQIFNSHPEVAYRFQPLFAYRFKDRISLSSSREEIHRFLSALYAVDDDEFILDRRSEFKGVLSHRKETSPSLMVMKMVRYHHLIGKLLEDVGTIKIVGMVRHPCAVISSWLQAPKEFKEGWNPAKEWRHAPKKNLGRIEEYNGFEKWKEAALMFLDLHGMYPERFYLLRYEDLLARPLVVVRTLFSFVGLAMHPQVEKFIYTSGSLPSEDPYSVFKSPQIKDRWRTELEPSIAAEIFRDLEGTRLEQFLS
jgi:hypothetical protein